MATTGKGSESGLTADTAPHPQLDALGYFYISLSVVWTAVIVTGIVFLYRKRKLPFLKIRGLPLSFAAVTLLHLYWISVQLGYVLGPIAPAVAEFWIMGIWFPLGISLFQAASSQFLYVAEVQKRLYRHGSIDEALREYKWPAKEGKSVSRWKRLVVRFRKMEYSKRILTFVIAGMVVQVCFSLIVAFHSH